jgi:hypothetical protein
LTQDDTRTARTKSVGWGLPRVSAKDEQEVKMTEAQIESVFRKPNPWLTLIPFWLVSGVVMLAVGAVTIMIMAQAAPKYHMNLIGEPVLLMSEAPPSQHARAGSQPDQQRAAEQPSRERGNE